ncbi:MAG: hypothetical protein ACR2P0_06765 [Acidimicrobiales bacterium]
MGTLDADSFDFWLGEWDCVFDGGHAVNTISREFDNRVTRERFVVDQPRAWSGTSMSVFHEHSGEWFQTWVDESGNYWHFVGSVVDGSPSFGTPVPVDAEKAFKRMVFTDITPDRFQWRWESSPDGGDWQVNWEIAYSRR